MRSETGLKVVCYHCGKAIPKDEAFYLKGYDAYYCEKHWKDILDGKPVRIPNWKKGEI